MSKVKSSDYIKLFQLEKLPFLINSIALKHYISSDVIALQINDIWKSYLPIEKMKETLVEGILLFSDKESFDIYKNEYNAYKENSLKYFDLILRKKVVLRDEIEKYLQLISDEWKYYRKTEFFYVDDAYRMSKTNHIIAKNLKELESIKTTGREHLNKLIFGNDSYLNRILEKINERFEVAPSDLLEYSESEIIGLFNDEKVEDTILYKRREAYVFIAQNNSIEILEGVEAKVFSDKFLVENITQEMHGTIANKGKITGIARVITYKVENFDKVSLLIKEMAEGDILIADTTSPEIISACKKASAILTNQGGLLSHAAIISREFNIPCIVGFGDITEKVRTGDTLEVDADNGTVRIIK